MSQHWASGQGPPRYPPGHWQLGDYTSLQNGLFALFTIILALSFLFIGFRVWSRRIKCLQLMPNDYLALAACFFNFVYFIVLLLGVFIGAGRDFQDLRNPFEQMKVSLQVNIAIAIFWSVVNTLVKLSMADLYTRLFPTKPMRITSLLFTLCVLTNFIFGLVDAALVCTIGESPTKTETSRRCNVAIGIINLFLDVAVIVMPMPWLYSLQLPVSKKLSLIGIFALGFIITAISTVRVVAFSSILGNVRGGNYAYNTFAMPLWSYLETSLSVINACLPVIFPALLLIGRSLSSSLSHLGSSFARRGSSGGVSFTSKGGEPRRVDNSTGDNSSRSILGLWKRGGPDKTLPALPMTASQGNRSLTRVNMGEEKGKVTSFLEDSRVRADEESLGEEQWMSQRQESMGRDDEGRIMVVKRWSVDYGL